VQRQDRIGPEVLENDDPNIGVQPVPDIARMCQSPANREPALGERSIEAVRSCRRFREGHLRQAKDYVIYFGALLLSCRSLLV
jgi:hypothetical protein